MIRIFVEMLAAGILLFLSGAIMWTNDVWLLVSAIDMLAGCWLIFKSIDFLPPQPPRWDNGVDLSNGNRLGV
jgi:hypothetical protein